MNLTISAVLSLAVILGASALSEFNGSLTESNQQLVPAKSFKRSISESTILNSYLRYQEMLDYISDLREINDGLIKVKKVGQTFEGRNIFVVKLSTNFTAKKPVVLMEAGIHAREWVAPSMALYMITKATQNQTLLAEYDWHIIPVTNPDGYEYSHVQERFWRKNRRNVGRGCFGVDGNRNFDVDFGKIGASWDPCSETYPGPHAFSEAESSAVKAAEEEVSNRVRVHISIHTYGPFITYPFGYDAGHPPPTAAAMDRCVKAAKTQMDQYEPNHFRVGNTLALLGAASGGSDDWAVAKMNVPYAFTVELPGGGKLGFDLPPNELENALLLSFRGLLQLTNCDKLH